MDDLQAKIFFLNLLESTTKMEIKKKSDFYPVYDEWCRLGKPKKMALRRAESLKQHIPVPITIQIVNREKLPITWNDLLR